MGNGENGLFLFVEQGTDPRNAPGLNVPVGSLCTFNGTTLRKTGAAPTSWADAGGAFSGGTVPQPTAFEDEVTCEDDLTVLGLFTVGNGPNECTIDQNGDAHIGGFLGVSGSATVTGNLSVAADLDVEGDFTPAGQIIPDGGQLDVVGGAQFTGNVNIQGTADLNVGGDIGVTGALTAPGIAATAAGLLGFFAAPPVAGPASAIPDPAGGGTVDAEARTAIAALLAFQRLLGFVAT